MSGSRRKRALGAMSLFIMSAYFLTCAAAGQDDQKPLAATLLSLHEFRNRSHLASHELHFEPGMSLAMNLSGEGLRDAVGYSDAHVTEATDDQGHSLITPTTDKAAANLDRMERSELHLIDRVGRPYPQPVFCSISLNLAPRSAKQIVKLRGTIQICTAGTGEQTIRISHARKWMDKYQMKEASLDKAGITLQLYQTIDPKVMGVEARGEFLSIKSIEILDSSSGRTATRVTRVLPESGDVRYEMEFIDATSQKSDFDLVCHLATGLKTITLPFELKDCPVKLP